jgi:hypothetical protein
MLPDLGSGKTRHLAIGLAFRRAKFAVHVPQD